MPQARQRAALMLFGASGACGIAYQAIWAQQAALWLGQDSAAVLAVVSAFFFGFAFGAWGVGRRIEASTRPGLWYAGCEAVIGGWAAFLALAMPSLADGLLRLIGADPHPARQWAVAFGGTTMLLLPATAAMGATLPAIERELDRWRAEGTSIPTLYAANTLGAVAGVLAITFGCMPAWGLQATLLACAAMNGAVALAAGFLFSASAAGGTRTAPAAPAREARATLAMLAATGFLGIAYEVLAVRVLRQHSENTVYTFALLLAAWLAATAFGSAAYGRLRDPTASPERVRGRLAGMLSLTVLASLLAMAAAPALRKATAFAIGPGFGAALFGEALIALAVLALPCAAMGALFAHLASEARAKDVALGRALAVNTLGGAIAPLVVGVAAVPLVGVRIALVAVAAGYLLLAVPRRFTWASAAGAASLLAVAAWGPALVFVDRAPDARVVRYEEGATAAVSVVESSNGIRTLRIDNRQQEGSNATLPADGRQALLPLVLHGAPRRVLFLGLGTGVTASAAAFDPALDVRAVELLPEVVRASDEFRAEVAPGRARLRTSTADARRYVRTARERFDVIVADNFHPARSGSSALYTVEHFTAVRERLAPDGLFCQWLPLHQLDLDTLRSIVRSFLVVYPNGQAILATLSLETPVVGLVSRPDAPRFAMHDLAARTARLPDPPGPLGLDAMAAMGSFIAGPRALAAFADDAPANTDDRPVVSFRAPRIAYAPDSKPADRLALLLSALRADRESIVADADPAIGDRIEAYWRARDRFLDLGRRVVVTEDARAMLARLRAPLQDILRESPEFRPAIEPLRRLEAANNP